MKDLQPYLKHVELFQKGMGVPRREELKKMADVYDKTLKDPALPKTNIGCAPCVKNMMNRIQGAINRGELKQAKKKEDGWFKGMKEANEKTFQELEDKMTYKTSKEMEVVVPSEMKWGELKSYAKEQGIKTKGMKKAEILEALK